MFKKICCSGYVVLLLYVAGVGFWIGALFSPAYSLFFCVAIICITAGFLRSLFWLWKHSIFERPDFSSPYSRRYSDRHPDSSSDIVSHEYAKTHVERRRRRRRRPQKRKKLRWTAEALSTLLFIAAALGIKNSYATRDYKAPPVIDVLLSDRRQIQTAPGRPPTIERVMARRAPFLGKNAAFRYMIFSMANTPTEDVPINQQDNSANIDVILKNISGTDVPNAHLTVESDVPITPVTEELVSLTNKQLYGNVSHLTPPDHSSDERVVTVKISIPRNHDTAGIYVTIQADNMRAYGAVARIFFVRHAAPSPSPDTAASLEESHSGKADIVPGHRAPARSDILP